MSAGGARRGRRDNGLLAAAYAAAGDVDPRVGEHLLDVLAASGIAAYLQPSSDQNPVTRTTTTPSRPTDRLFVDRAHLETAREYVARLAAEEEQAGRGGRVPDIDAEWARIVAGFNAEVDPASRSWPAAENLDRPDRSDRPDRRRAAAAPDTPTGYESPGVSGVSDGSETGEKPDTSDKPGEDHPADRAKATGTTDADDRTDNGADDRTDDRTDDRPTERPQAPGRWRLGPTDRATDRATERRRRPAPGADEPSLLDALDTFGRDLPDDPSDDEGYTPPPPPPLPRISKYAVAAVIAVVAGFGLFLFPDLLPLDSDVVMLFGFTCILAGFVTLVWRLRPGDDEEDEDPENGAVV